MNPDIVLSQWSRLGAFFNIEPAKDTPDIEELLIETAKFCPQIPRLMPVCVTWLIQYYRLVCRHRLAKFAADIFGTDASATLGLILTTVKHCTGTDHFNLSIKKCTATGTPKPLFLSDRKSAGLAKLAQSRSGDLARQWGLWCEEVELKNDAIRPLGWLMDRNPELKHRALFGGNLRASILETLRFCPDAGQSESALARQCCATRKAVREALDHLEFCQLVLRIHDAGKVRIALNDNHLKQSA
ncbi:MAG: hypothetical protein ABFR90_04995 [Planctomycetota bacterium]